MAEATATSPAMQSDHPLVLLHDVLLRLLLASSKQLLINSIARCALVGRALIVLPSSSDWQFLRRCDHIPHLVLHLLEVIHKFVLALVLNMTHLLADLLLQGSVALRLLLLQLNWLLFATD